MAHGAPDWWSRAYIDIISQTVAELVNRPVYGAFVNAEASLVVHPGDDDLLFTITGEGMIYGGYYRLATAAAASTITPWLIIDGEILESDSVYTMYAYGLNQPNASLLYVMGYDTVNGYYSVGISTPITFTTSILAYMSVTAAGANTTCECHLYHALT